HTTERNQFGRALAKFQSVQNLVVDLAAEAMLARAAVDSALADALTEDLAGELSGFRVAVARSVVSQAVAVAVRNAHQVHGAIGTTHEHTLHRVTLPALQWRSEFGSASFWEGLLTRLAVAGGMDAAWPMIVEGRPVDDGPADWLAAVTGACPRRRPPPAHHTEKGPPGPCPPRSYGCSSRPCSSTARTTPRGWPSPTGSWRSAATRWRWAWSRRA